MKCSKIKSNLFEYFSGNLEGEKFQKVQMHVEKCPDCFRLLAEMRRMVFELNRMKKVSAPSDFLARVRRKAAHDSPLKKGIKFLFIPFKLKLPIQLAVMGVIGVLIFFMLPAHYYQPLTTRQVPQLSKPEKTNQNSNELQKPISTGEKREGSYEPNLADISEHTLEKEKAAKKSEAPAGVEMLFKVAVVSISQEEKPQVRDRPDRVKALSPGRKLLQDSKKAPPALPDPIQNAINKFDAVVLSQTIEPSGTRRLKMLISSINYGPFFDHLKQFGVVKTPATPLPIPLHEKIVVELQVDFGG